MSNPATTLAPGLAVTGRGGAVWRRRAARFGHVLRGVASVVFLGTLAA
jgi:hypothetical protein